MSESDDKKARLEAIRAANRAKREAEGGAAPAAVAQPVAAATATAEGPAAAGGVPDDKQARLEAIRAANRSKTEGGAAVATAAAPAATPARAAAPAAAPARPAARAAAPVTTRDYMLRAAIGAVLGIIVCLGLATMTGHYLTAAVFGLFLGAVTGILAGSWPPTETTGD